MKKLNYKPIFLAVLGIAAVGCTDLEIEETDSRFGEQTGEFTGVDAEGVLTNIYNDLRAQIETQENLYALSEVSTDEFVVPTRGTDWGDNGVWRTLHSHTWDANHAFVRNTWNAFNQNVFNATAVMDSRSNPTPQEVAEAKFIRAFSMFWINDIYGQVPFREVDDPIEAAPVVFTRSEAVDFIMTDLNDAIAGLPDAPAGGSNRATADAARFLMAKLLLNKHIYTGTGTPETADMQQVIDIVDELAANGFGLTEDGYFEMFTDAPDSETIWFTASGAGPLIWNGLHYNQNSPDNTGGGWNGFTTIAEFYDLFEGDPNINIPGSGQEERRGFVPAPGTANPPGPDNLGIGFGFLIGQQYNEDGTALTDRPGRPLEFSKELPGLLGNDERTGIRVIKYHPVNGAFAGHRIVFRYADAHLMKAEAMLRLGQDPTAMVNELRVNRGASPLGSVSEQDILDERGRELYGEYWRRNDLIRFGQFINEWSYKEISGDPNKQLFPIPVQALTSNPNLVQNPGY